MGDQNEKIIKIFDVIKYCFVHSKPPKIVRKQINLDISHQAIEAAKKVYEQQLHSKFGKMIIEEKDLLYFLAVGYTQNVPFLNNLVDLFTIDRVNHFKEKQNNLSVPKWFDEYNK